MDELPLYPYTTFSKHGLKIAHSADEVIPVIAIFYTFMLFLLYCFQYQQKRNWYSTATIPLHRLAMLSIFICFIHSIFLYILSNNYYTSLPSLINSCSSFIRLTSITFVFAKYIMTLCIILNLSQIIQNPFINPRYKYIGKKRRLTLRNMFRIIVLLLIFFFILSLYGEWDGFESVQFTSSNDDALYCTPTVSVSSFFWVFSDDILLIVAYAISFGRNAFTVCRLSVRPKRKIKYLSGDLSSTSGYDDDKNSDYNNIKYDDNDPITQCIKNEIYCGNPLISNPFITNSCKSHVQSTLINGTKNVTVLAKRKNDFSDLIVELDEEDLDDFKLNMERDSKTIKLLRQSTLIEAKELITNEELMGLAEQKRVLILIWIIIVFYWTNILLFIVYGLFQSITSLLILISATIIILFNDYEFGSTYWKYRRIICGISAAMCCLCGKTYFCKDCFCGNEKVYKDNFNSINNENGHSIPMEHQQFVRL